MSEHPVQNFARLRQDKVNVPFDVFLDDDSSALADELMARSMPKPKLSGRVDAGLFDQQAPPTALGDIVAKDPVAAAKAVASVPFTIAPDLLGMAQGGLNSLANLAFNRATSLIVPGGMDLKDRQLPFPDSARISGNPIREDVFGLEPIEGLALDSPQFVGEILSPIGTMAKALGIGVKAVIAGAKLAAGTSFPVNLAAMWLHASPFKFSKFSGEFVGTGEGRNAIAHGLNFTKDEHLANLYKKDLNEVALELPGTDPGVQRQLGRDFNNSDFDSVDDIPNDWYENAARGYEADGFPVEAAAIRAADKSKARMSESQLYEVSIPDETVAKMLDRDLPLSEQPEVVARLKAAELADDTHLFSIEGAKPLSEVSGEEVYIVVADAFGEGNIGKGITAESKAEGASKFLNEIGIPGVKYLEGQGKRNIVVFNPDDITQVKRDGKIVHTKTAIEGQSPVGTATKDIANKPLASLTVPKAAAEARLGRKLKRKPGIGVQKNNPQMLKAPGQPGFAVGRISTNDWIARTELILTPQEIQAARTWYKDIKDAFEPAFGENADLMITAWLVANKNVTPEGALANALRVAEQIQVGSTGKKGGLADTVLRQIFKGEEVEKGVGQKLFDFIDSATGRLTRRYYGDAPAAGAPTVIDVHSFRDMGYVDQALLNVLEKKGYNVKGLKNDVPNDSISEGQYEQAGDQLREMSKQLNDLGFAGGNLTPTETQAIGWTAMSKFMGAKGDDPLRAITGNIRRIAFELAPGRGSPNAAKFGDRFAALDLDQQIEVTNKTLDGAMSFIEETIGIQASTLVHGTGGWQRLDPQAAQVAQLLASKEGAELASNMIGYLAQQEAVWVTKIKPLTQNPKGFAIMLTGDNLSDQNTVRSLWGTILDKDKTGLIQGYQPVTDINGKPGILILIDKGGKKTAERINTEVRKTLEDVIEQGPTDDILIEVGEAEITKAGTGSGAYDGQSYLERIRELGRKDLIPSLDNHRVKLTKEFGKNLTEAERKAKTEVIPIQ